jgi:hypothetical protein
MEVYSSQTVPLSKKEFCANFIFRHVLWQKRSRFLQAEKRMVLPLREGRQPIKRSLPFRDHQLSGAEAPNFLDSPLTGRLNAALFCGCAINLNFR